MGHWQGSAAHYRYRSKANKMTTPTDFRRLVRPLLDSNPDLALSGRLIVVRPLQNFIRSIYVDRTDSGLYFRPVWAINSLFDPKHSFSLNYGGRFYPIAEGLWTPDRPRLGEEFRDRVETDVLPLLRVLPDFATCRTYLMTGDFPGGNMSHDFGRRVFIDAAQGDWAPLDDVCKGFSNNYARNFGQRDVADLEPVVLTLAPLVAARDRD